MVGGRTRKQSARALEAQEHAAIEYGEESASVAMAPQTARQRSRTAAKGKATAVDEVEQDEDSVMQLDDGAGSDDGNEAEPDLTLCAYSSTDNEIEYLRKLTYRHLSFEDCICLGFDTGEQRMIQCEHCSNWWVTEEGGLGPSLRQADLSRVDSQVSFRLYWIGQRNSR